MQNVGLFLCSTCRSRSIATNTVLVMRYVMDVFLFVRIYIRTWFWWAYWPLRDSFLFGTGCTLKLQCTGCRKSIQKLLYFLQPHPGKLILSFPLSQRKLCRFQHISLHIYCFWSTREPLNWSVMHRMDIATENQYLEWIMAGAQSSPRVLFPESYM